MHLTVNNVKVTENMASAAVISYLDNIRIHHECEGRRYNNSIYGASPHLLIYLQHYLLLLFKHLGQAPYSNQH